MYWYYTTRWLTLKHHIRDKIVVHEQSRVDMKIFFDFRPGIKNAGMNLPRIKSICQKYAINQDKYTKMTYQDE